MKIWTTLYLSLLVIGCSSTQQYHRIYLSENYRGKNLDSRNFAILLSDSNIVLEKPVAIEHELDLLEGHAQSGFRGFLRKNWPQVFQKMDHIKDVYFAEPDSQLNRPFSTKEDSSSASGFDQIALSRFSGMQVPAAGKPYLLGISPPDYLLIISRFTVQIDERNIRTPVLIVPGATGLISVTKRDVERTITLTVDFALWDNLQSKLVAGGYCLVEDKSDGVETWKKLLRKLSKQIIDQTPLK